MASAENEVPAVPPETHRIGGAPREAERGDLGQFTANHRSTCIRIASNRRFRQQIAAVKCWVEIMAEAGATNRPRQWAPSRFRVL